MEEVTTIIFIFLINIINLVVDKKIYSLFLKKEIKKTEVIEHLSIVELR